MGISGEIWEISGKYGELLENIDSEWEVISGPPPSDVTPATSQDMSPRDGVVVCKTELTLPTILSMIGKILPV